MRLPLRNPPRVQTVVTLMLAIAAGCAGDPGAGNASVQTRALGAADEHPVPATFIAGVQELRDGRLVVADPREQAIRLVNFQDGSARRIGREGRGPGEYLGPREVLRWRGDTLLVYDVGNRRLHKVNETGQLSGHLDLPPELSIGRVLAPPGGADESGHVYAQVELVPLPRDSVRQERRGMLFRWHPDSARMDSIASLMTREPERQELRVAYFPMQDGWAVLPDGRVGIARAHSYRVEWLHPGGETRRGPLVEVDPVALTAQEREAHAESMSSPSASGRLVGPSTGRGAAVRLPDEEQRYPAAKPPFEARGRQGELGVRASPRGELWVTRSRAWNDSASTVDVFDTEGRRIRVVTLPPHTRVVGFGAAAVYLARRDAEDLEWLQRIPLR